MKKILLSSAALLLSAVVAVPASVAATHGRVTVTSSSDQAGVSHVGASHVSRHQLESGVWAIRAKVRTGYTHPKSFVTDKPSSSSSGTSSSGMSSSTMNSSAMSSSSMSH